MTEELPGCFHGGRARAEGRQGRTGQRRDTRARAHAPYWDTRTQGYTPAAAAAPHARQQAACRGSPRAAPGAPSAPCPRLGPAPARVWAGGPGGGGAVRLATSLPPPGPRPHSGVAVRGRFQQVLGLCARAFTLICADTWAIFKPQRCSRSTPPPCYQSFCIFSQKRTAQSQTIYAPLLKYRNILLCFIFIFLVLFI